MAVPTGSSFPSHLALGPGTRRELLDGLQTLRGLMEGWYGEASPKKPPWWPIVRIPGSGVLLGSWTSPAGWPWEIGVVRVRWDLDKDQALLPDFPALVLEPRPWPRLTGRRELAKAFHRYQQREPGQPPRRQVRWTPDTDPPTAWSPLPGTPTWAHPAQAWEASMDIMGRLGSSAMWDGPTTKRTTALITRLWRDTPWLFLLHPGLQGRIQRTLGLPPRLEAAPCMAAAHAAEAGVKGRKGAWPPGRLVARLPGSGHPEPIHVAYDWLLDRNEGQSRAIIAFLEGQASPEGITTSAEDIPKKLSERLAELDEGFIQPMMLPFLEEALPAVESQGDQSTDDVLALWLSSRAPQALWLAFGVQAKRIGMATEDGGTARGLEAILRVQHRGHLVPLNRPPRGWDRTWGWRWVVPVDEAEGVDEPSEAQKSGAER